jgi:hypothetical protein
VKFEIFKKFKEWDKRNEKAIKTFTDTMLLLFSVFGMCASAFSIIAGFHSLDLSVNMLLVLGNPEWRQNGDIYDYEIANESVIYHSLPYPALYIKGTSIMIYSFIIGCVSAFGFGFALRGLLRRVEK